MSAMSHATRRTWVSSGLSSRSTRSDSAAIRPSSVCMPVAKTTACASPSVHEVPENTRFRAWRSGTCVSSSSAARSIGIDSPLSVERSTSTRPLSSRASAEMRSPSSITSTSPGTRRVASTTCSCPSRSTFACAGRNRASASTARSAWTSWANAKPALITMTATMATATGTIPAAQASAAAAQSSRARGWANWRISSRGHRRPARRTSALGPYCSSRRSASRKDKPDRADRRSRSSRSARSVGSSGRRCPAVTKACTTDPTGIVGFAHEWPTGGPMDPQEPRFASPSSERLRRAPAVNRQPRKPVTQLRPSGPCDASSGRTAAGHILAPLGVDQGGRERSRPRHGTSRPARPGQRRQPTHRGETPEVLGIRPSHTVALSARLASAAHVKTSTRVEGDRDALRRPDAAGAPCRAWRRGHEAEGAMTPRAPAPAFDGASLTPPEGVVALLFTDLVGSTSVLERLGDVAAEKVRRTYFRLLREAVSRHSGQEVKSLGDGLMVVFGSAVEAVGCAVAVQDAVERHNRRHPDAVLWVRVGLHVGEPVRDERDFFGTAVVVAQRLCDRAAGGQILASELVRGLVDPRGQYGFRSVGRLPLKGLSERVAAFEVVWAQSSPPPPVSQDARVNRRTGVLHTRLLAPRPPSDALERPGLRDQILGGFRGRLIALVAGRLRQDHLLALALEQAESPWVWCSCDERIGDGPDHRGPPRWPRCPRASPASAPAWPCAARRRRWWRRSATRSWPDRAGRAPSSCSTTCTRSRRGARWP